MGRHSAGMPASELLPPDPGDFQPVTQLGGAAVGRHVAGEMASFNTEYDTSGVVDTSHDMLQPHVVEQVRNYYVAGADHLPEDMQDYTAEDFVTVGRANHMSAHERAIILDTREGHAAALIHTLETRAPRMHDQHFITRDTLLAQTPDRSQAIILESDPEGPFMHLPVRNFVYAEGFVSWQEGRGHNVKKVDEHGVRTPSSELLRSYAARTTQAPPLEKVVGFVQPNGLVLYTTRQGSHRTAAAIARGDQSVEVRTLSLLMLEDNIVSLEEAEQQSRQN